MKRLWLLLTTLGLGLLAGAASAQTGAVNGYCTLGGAHTTVSGLASANFHQGIIPKCTVTVYLTGTTTPATLYSNQFNAPLANPFTANADGSWLFFMAMGQGVDVQMSGGVGPNTYPAPVAYTDVLVGSTTANVYSAIGVLPVSNGGTGSATASLLLGNPVGNQIAIQPAGTTLAVNSLNGAQFPVTAKADAVVASGSMLVGSAILTTSSNTFNCATDSGKAIVVAGAGATQTSSTNLYGQLIPTALTATIASCQSATQVTLSANAAVSTTNAWMAFGTDDTATIRSCVNAGTNLGGVCALLSGRTYMASDSTPTIFITNTNGGVIEGNGATIISAATGPSTQSSNNQIFGVTSSLSQRYQIDGSVAIGAFTFTAHNVADAALLKPGQQIVLTETDSVVNDNEYVDWVQVASVSGATVTLAHASRMVFPGTHVWGPTSGLNWRIVTNLAQNVTIRNLKLINPNVAYSTGFVPSILGSGAQNLTLNNVTCVNASSNCFAADYDQGDKILNNHFYASQSPEFAVSVDETVANNTFSSLTAPINNLADACTGGVSANGIQIDLGTAFSSFTGNKIVNPCDSGITSYYGVHDNVISGNTVGYILGTDSRQHSGLVMTGGYRNRVADNTFAGAQGSTATVGIVTANTYPGSVIYSDQNIFSDNAVTGFVTPYSLGGTLKTDALYGVDPATRNLTFVTPIQIISTLGLGTEPGYGNPIVPAPVINGGGSHGIETQYGSSSGALVGYAGTIAGNAASFSATNATQTLSGVDKWHQTNSGFASALSQNDITGGFSVYNAPAGQADGTLAAFWGTPKFSVSVNGAVSAPSLSSGIANFTGAVTAASLSAPSGSISGSPICTTATGCGSGSNIANVAIALPTTAIAANTCTAAATVTMSGLLTTSTFTTAFATDPSAVVGWGANGGLAFEPWPTANTLNYKVCNQSPASVTPGALSLNVGAK